MDIDQKWMQKTLDLANNGFIQISPDPFRGALLAQGDTVVGEGYLANRDSKDPELHALEAAGEKAQGATLYINLETAFGSRGGINTVETVIAAGIKRVVCAMADPNPKVAGKSLFEYKMAGIEVEVGLMKEEAQNLNEIYNKDASTHRPFVHLICGMSLDGKMATRTRDSKGLITQASREYVHKLRARYDAIMIGVNTLLEDNPKLQCNFLRARDPWRVVIDSEAKTPNDANIFLRSNPDAPRPPVVIAIGYGAHEEHLRSLRHAGADILHCPDEEASGSSVDLERLLPQLHKKGITSVLIEGGATLRAAALQAGIVDKVSFIVSPQIIGGKEAPSPISGEGAAFVLDAQQLSRVSTRSVGRDILIEGYLDS